jgi:hypothetical protein
MTYFYDTFLGYKTAIGIMAALISFVAMLPYLWSVWHRITKPHVISWFIWGISTLTVFAAQWLDDGGAGSWATCVGGMMTFIVIGMAWMRYADLSVSLTDLLCLNVALAALPLWFFAEDALLAVALLTFVDIVAYIPTFRKSWHNPRQEQRLMYGIMTLRNILSIIALEHLSATTLLFPVVTAVANIALISFITVRRRMVTT